MPKFRKKPVVIEAEQYLHHGHNVKGLCQSHSCHSRVCSQPHVHTIHDGQHVVLEVGDWVIPESDGEHFYPCKPDTFEATYEPEVTLTVTEVNRERKKRGWDDVTETCGVCDYCWSWETVGHRYINGGATENPDCPGTFRRVVPDPEPATLSGMLDNLTKEAGEYGRRKRMKWLRDDITIDDLIDYHLKEAKRVLRDAGRHRAFSLATIEALCNLECLMPQKPECKEGERDKG